MHAPFSFNTFSVLRLPTNWHTGKPIIASAADVQPGQVAKVAAKPPAVEIHEHIVSQLVVRLNDDCVLHLYKFLPALDIIQLAKTDPHLSMLAKQHVYPLIARRTGHEMFTVNGAHRLQRTGQMKQSVFLQAIQCFGPHLRQLTINGRMLVSMRFPVPVMAILLDKCPNLVSLRLFNFHQPENRSYLPMQGLAHYRFSQLRELCLTNCYGSIDDDWLIFIGRLPRLETLMLHDSLFEQEEDYHCYRLLYCSSLRKLSISSKFMNESWLTNTLERNEETLRELYCDLRYNYSYPIRYLMSVVNVLPDLQSMLFKPHPKDVSQRYNINLMNPANLVQVAKIIFYRGNADALVWLIELSKLANSLQYVVLLEVTLTEGMLNVLSIFRKQLRVMELRRSNLTAGVLIDLWGRQRALERLKIRQCNSVGLTDALRVALRWNVRLHRIVLYDSFLSSAVFGELIEELRASVAELQRARQRLLLIFMEGDRTNYDRWKKVMCCVSS